MCVKRGKPLPLASESGRWLLVAAGTKHYEYLGEADLDTVPAEVERVVGALSGLGYQRCLEELGSDPSSSEFRAILPKWLQTLGQDDVVVVYYTSHGARDQERFYLLTRDSEQDSLDTTSVPAEDLARWVSKNTQVSQVLVILDACYSGAGAAEFTAVVGKVAAASGGNSAVFVVAAARSKQEAAQGVLSSAIEAALANADGRLGGAAQEFLTLDDVMESVDVFLQTHNPSQTATWSSANVRGRARLFRNPRFLKQVQSGLDLESQRALLEVLGSHGDGCRGRAIRLVFHRTASGPRSDRELAFRGSIRFASTYCHRRCRLRQVCFACPHHDAVSNRLLGPQPSPTGMRCPLRPSHLREA